MLNVEIAELVRPMVDGVEFGKDGRVNVWKGFRPFEDEETHDAAWSAYIFLQEQLEPHGLLVTDYWSDNDTIGGVVENIPSEADS